MFFFFVFFRICKKKIYIFKISPQISRRVVLEKQRLIFFIFSASLIDITLNREIWTFSIFKVLKLRVFFIIESLNFLTLKSLKIKWIIKLKSCKTWPLNSYFYISIQKNTCSWSHFICEIKSFGGVLFYTNPSLTYFIILNFAHHTFYKTIYKIYSFIYYYPIRICKNVIRVKISQLERRKIRFLSRDFLISVICETWYKRLGFYYFLLHEHFCIYIKYIFPDRFVILLNGWEICLHECNFFCYK